MVRLRRQLYGRWRTEPLRVAQLAPCSLLLFFLLCATGYQYELWHEGKEVYTLFA